MKSNLTFHVTNTFMSNNKPGSSLCFDLPEHSMHFDLLFIEDVCIPSISYCPN